MKRMAMAALAAWLGAGTAGAQAFDWSGFYAGVQGGYFMGDLEVTYEATMVGTVNVDGPFAGVFAGFNAQHNSIVFGIEGDVNFVSASGEAYDEQTLYAYGGEIDMFGSLRKRIGVATDNWLFFGTAGIAFAQGTFWSQYCPDGCIEPFTADASLFGYVIGAGAEYAVSDNVTVRADIRYYNFGAEEVQFGAAVEDTALYDLDALAVSTGVSWHF